ncbi:MAG TPA: hypothetical protein VLU96_11145 [Gaiellaceae bacterium]|nr:hypothetical protein [Gaiellaceae bacterium]
MRRLAFLAAALALALLLPGGALGNGDPASDTLPFQQVFLPYEAPVSASAATRLKKTVAAANEKGYKIRVALIPFTGDLGTAVVLWKKPQLYSEFLGKEIAFSYTGRTLIAMPSGFGLYNGGKPVTNEVAALKPIQPGQTPTDLANSASDAVRALAAADGVSVPKSFGSSATHDRLILAAGLVVLALLVAIPVWFVRRRARGGGRSPSAEPR